jgi:hypothetical protein
LTARINGLVSDSIAIISGVLVIFAGVLIGVGENLGGRIVSVLLILFGFAGGVFTLVDLLNRGH